MGDDLRTAVEEFDDVRNVEDVLIESGEKENLVALERAADGASDLLLAVVRLEGEEGIGGSEGTVAQIVERGAVDVIRAGLGDDVDDGAAGGIGGDAELLHDFGGELIGSAIASASLGEEGVVVVVAVNEEGGLESANAAEREIAVGGGGEAAGILRDAGGEESEIGEAAAVEREIAEGAFVEERGHGAGLGFDESGRGGNGDGLVGSGDGEAETQVGGATDIDMKLRRDLGRHAWHFDAGRIVAGREKIESEAAFFVALDGVAAVGGGVDDDDRGLGDDAAARVDHGAANGSGGGVLRHETHGSGHHDDEKDKSEKRENARCRHEVASECEIVYARSLCEIAMRSEGRPDAR